MPLRFSLVCTLVFGAFFAQDISQAQEGPAPATNRLKEFSKQIDESYRFEVVEKRQVGSSRIARLHMVSQKWKDVSWKHVVWVIIPSKAIEKPQEATSRSAILLVDGGGWRKEWGDEAPQQIERVPPFQVSRRRSRSA
ncbi:MAG: PhoPQ-activated protein PqaA family protein [Pirellula sp.]